ncbi:hypothetical protein MFUL124B02_23950 [Myxococcus fulvus 124B02]|nr:hypothetical protein MFUL124B02_23950 [Myxococcus fulvus 124B02]
MNYRVRRHATQCAFVILLAMALPSPASAQAISTFIMNDFHYRCLDANGFDRIQPNYCPVPAGPHWLFDQVPGAAANVRTIRAPNTESCMEAGDESILYRQCTGAKNQQWIVERHEARPPSSGVRGIRIRSVERSTQCIDAYRANQVRLWECGTSQQQQWNIFGSLFDQMCPLNRC